MPRAIVTGASGFVGANLTRRLVREGYDVHLLVRPGTSTWRIDDLRPSVAVLYADIRDSEAVGVAVRDIRPEVIFHLAAHGAYAWQSDADRIRATNTVGTDNLLDAAVRWRVRTVVNTGSSLELRDESSPYAVSKAQATRACQTAALTHAIGITTLRLYSVFGPFEEPARLIPTLIASGLRGRLPRLAQPNLAHDFVYVEDVVEALVLAANRAKGGETFDVGSGRQTTLAEVVELTRRTFGIEAAPDWGSYPARSWDSSTWVSDTRKISRELGWRCRYTFEDGFRAMVEWVAAHPSRYVGAPISGTALS